MCPGRRPEFGGQQARNLKVSRPGLFASLSSAGMLCSRLEAKPKQPVKSEYETLAAFRYALRQFLRFSESAAREAGITAQQHQALPAVKGFPGRDRVTLGELAERLQLRHHTTVGLEDRLVAEKLVMRAPSAEDCQQVLIQLTKRGEIILEKLAAVHRQQLWRIGPEIRQRLGHLCGSEE